MSQPTLSSAQVLVPSRVDVYFAKVGTPAPSLPTGPFTGWRRGGHTAPDSMTFETSPEFDAIDSGQSDYDIKKFQTKDAASVQVDLRQWNTGNFQAVYGGGTVTAVDEVASPGVYRFTPPRLGEREEIACLLHVREGGKNYLWDFPKAMQVEGVSLGLTKGSGVVLPVRLDILGGDDTDAWGLTTDDPAFSPPAE